MYSNGIYGNREHLLYCLIPSKYLFLVTEFFIGPDESVLMVKHDTIFFFVMICVTREAKFDLQVSHLSHRKKRADICFCFFLSLTFSETANHYKVTKVGIGYIDRNILWFVSTPSAYRKRYIERKWQHYHPCWFVGERLYLRKRVEYWFVHHFFFSDKYSHHWV